MVAGAQMMVVDVNVNSGNLDLSDHIVNRIVQLLPGLKNIVHEEIFSDPAWLIEIASMADASEQQSMRKHSSRTPGFRGFYTSISITQFSQNAQKTALILWSMIKKR